MYLKLASNSGIYVPKDDLELLIFLPLPPEFWDYRHASLCLIYIALKMDPGLCLC